MNEFLNKKITISQVIEFLERCFSHNYAKVKNNSNVISDNLSNFEFLDINMDMPDINLELQDIAFEFADIKFNAIAA